MFGFLDIKVLSVGFGIIFVLILLVVNNGISLFVEFI